MFDLDHAISHWRSQLIGNGVKSPAVLDELESHVREEVDQQLQSGLVASDAFDYAVQQIGRASLIRTEFAKIPRLNMKLKHAFLTLAGIPTQYAGASINPSNP